MYVAHLSRLSPASNSGLAPIPTSTFRSATLTRSSFTDINSWMAFQLLFLANDVIVVYDHCGNRIHHLILNIQLALWGQSAPDEHAWQTFLFRQTMCPYRQHDAFCPFDFAFPLTFRDSSAKANSWWLDTQLVETVPFNCGNRAPTLYFSSVLAESARFCAIWTS